jgi:hypothetical protein
LAGAQLFGGGFLNYAGQSGLQLFFILLALLVLNPAQTGFFWVRSPARVQQIYPHASGKLLQANGGEVAEWLNAAVC